MAGGLTAKQAREAAPAVLGLPHTSFNWYPGYPRKPQYHSVLIYYTQGGGEHVCSGATIGYDDPFTATTVEGPANIVWTAGRCLHLGDGSSTGWSDNVLACPVYGAAVSPTAGAGGPFITGQGGTPNTNEGCWLWNAEATTPEWFGDNMESRDYGVIFLSNNRLAGTCTATACTLNPTGAVDIAAYPTTPTNNAKATLTLCDESTYNGHVPGRTPGSGAFCAYNLARAQHWWSVGYHNFDTLAGEGQPSGFTTPDPAAPADVRCSWAPPGPPPNFNYDCYRQVLRVTQSQFASTHAALPPVPTACTPGPTCAADTGPLVNTVGAYEQAGVDSTRISGPCPIIGNDTGVDIQTAQAPPCTGSFTGAPWVLNWTGGTGGAGANLPLRGRFGSAMLNSNTTYADAGEDDRPDGAMQGVYFDTITCFDYQAWTGWTGIC